MSNATRSASQNARSARDEQRRKRKERSARSSAPEPKNIVSGAGQPLDLSVRRELEEQLGHDFSQVRLHTGRDAGQLAELMGADAFAVGQDVFFREGTYRPGTADGRRLLAHELLHTVQNPHGLGALRAGRDLGAVSLPQEAVEREAESAAQESVRAAMLGATREDDTTPGVEPGHATPGWLRYATLDADRRRQELLDPATLVDRLASGVLRSLRGDPEDRSKRARRQLAQLPDELQDAVLDRLERRLLSSEQERLLDLVAEIESDEDLEQNALDAPMVETDPAEELRFAREEERRAADGQREQEQRPGPAPGPEKDGQEAAGAAGSTPRNGGTREDGTTLQGGNAPGGPAAQGRDAGPGGRQEQQPGGGGAAPAAASGAPGAAPAQQAPESAPAAPGGQPADKAAAGDAPSADGKSSDGTSSGGAPQSGGKEDKKDAGADGREGTEREGTPVAGKEESAAKNRPGAVDALVAGQQVKPQDKRGQEKPSGSPTAARAETLQPGAVSTLDGVRTQDLEGPQEQVDDDPFGTGSQSEVEVGGGQPSAWDVTLQPDDFLPAQDLDVSTVPTADQLDSGSSAAPSFPAPPVTKADKVQAERDAEDAEDAAAGVDSEEDVDEAPAGAETADAAGPDDGTGEETAPDRSAEALTAPGTASKNPTSGADPKAGPVAAQVTVQEAPGRPAGGGEATEQATKEEKGTPAAGEAAGPGQEKGAPQAAGGTSAAAQSAGGEKPAAGGGEQQQTAADKGESAGAGTQASSPGRDSQVSGGSNANASGGASTDAAAGAQREPSGGGTASRTEGPAEQGAPAGGEHGT
ncbi:DUF4157 domain-containing protein, partial [Streptomyces sp. NPDC093707]|uniref:eCIS core domain-containing protein n=1 Tax=Streptomyces sp. NPDC093707 TaxID=3154984 RepID=UPI00344DB2FF